MVIDIVVDGAAYAASLNLRQRVEPAARLVQVAGAVKVGGFRVFVEHQTGGKIRVRLVALGDHPIVLPEEQGGFAAHLIGLADKPTEDIALIVLWGQLAAGSRD